MKKISFIIITFYASSIFAIECGQYIISGVPRKIENKAYVLVNEKTASEIKLLIELRETPKIVPYINIPIILEAKILTKANGTNATLSDLQKIIKRVPNPLSIPPDTGMKLMNPLNCK